MRLHRNLCFTVIDSLHLIFNEGEYASKVVEKALKRDKRWGARDRKFVAETIYDVVRWKRLYNEIAGTKEHYTRDNLWKLFAVWAVLKGITLPDWKYFEGTPFDVDKITFTVSKIHVPVDCIDLKNQIIDEKFADWYKDEIYSSELFRTNGRSEESRVGKECRARWSPYH